MPPRRKGLGAMRQINIDLEQARKDEKEAKQRIERLTAARAQLRGEPAPLQGKHRRRATRDDVRKDLLEHPNSYSSEVAERLGIPATNAGSHLSNGKKDGEFKDHKGQWSVIKEQT
jgi:hypothetical protein